MHLLFVHAHHFIDCLVLHSAGQALCVMLVCTLPLNDVMKYRRYAILHHAHMQLHKCPTMLITACAATALTLPRSGQTARSAHSPTWWQRWTSIQRKLALMAVKPSSISAEACCHCISRRCEGLALAFYKTLSSCPGLQQREGQFFMLISIFLCWQGGPCAFIYPLSLS